MKGDVLKRLQEWYQSMCNGDWEHNYGVAITTLDNPGWNLKVDLVDTPLCGRKVPWTLEQRQDEDDWVGFKIDDMAFDGSCGPRNLEELIERFLEWTVSTRSA